MKDLIKVGAIVHLWECCSSYGVITKVNKKTFAVSHNLHGRTLFNKTPKHNKDLDFICKDRLFNGTLLTELDSIILEKLLYKGLWWNEDLENKVKEYYKV